jgi:hypothetical protein
VNSQVEALLSYAWAGKMALSCWLHVDFVHTTKSYSNSLQHSSQNVYSTFKHYVSRVPMRLGLWCAHMNAWLLVCCVCMGG